MISSTQNEHEKTAESLLRSDTYVRLVLRALWEELPSIIGAGLLFSLCALPAFLLFGVGLLAPTVVVSVVTVAPACSALLAVTHALLLGKHAGPACFIRTFRQQWRTATQLGLCLAIPLLITLLTLPLLQLEPVPLLVWLGLAANGFVTALLLVVLFYAMPLGVAEPAPTGLLLRRGLHLAAQQPGNSVGLLALGLLLLWLVVWVSLGLLLLLPAVYALFIAANYQLVQNGQQQPE